MKKTVVLCEKNHRLLLGVQDLFRREYGVFVSLDRIIGFLIVSKVDLSELYGEALSELS